MQNSFSGIIYFNCRLKLYNHLWIIVNLTWFFFCFLITKLMTVCYFRHFLLFCLLIFDNKSTISIFKVYYSSYKTQVRIYGEPYAHKFCAVEILWNITRRQAISPAANFITFYDSAGEIDFYQMSLSQSESTSIILLNTSILFCTR